MSKFAEILASGARHADEVGRDGWTVELRVLPRGIGVSVAYGIQVDRCYRRLTQRRKSYLEIAIENAGFGR